MILITISNTHKKLFSFSIKQAVVMKLFDNQRRQKADEFTQWCTNTLSKFKSSIDSKCLIRLYFKLLANYIHTLF